MLVRTCPLTTGRPFDIEALIPMCREARCPFVDSEWDSDELPANCTLLVAALASEGGRIAPPPSGQGGGEKTLRLLRAAWESGYRAGVGAGRAVELDYYERGDIVDPFPASEAWEEVVAWRLDTDASHHLDPSDPEAWGDVS